MKMSFIEELKWRNLLQDFIPGTDELLQKEMVTAYVGFDPTADSLHIGNMVPIMLLSFLQRHGHRPIALVGGATGMIGDPSGKSEERNLLSIEELRHNEACIQQQLSKFIDFDCGENSALIVNNYDWFSTFSFLDFIRTVGKHITVNYMMAKDSVKNRMETGISFTEFSYQLLQGYDFLHLYRAHNCKLQMGGSDQWGNIVTGTELVRRMDAGSAFALTAPLLTKADGSKMGKSEGGNVWLDINKTSAYKFYQYFVNLTDEEVLKVLPIFSFKDKETIQSILNQHAEAPHLRLAQTEIGVEMTERVHGITERERAVQASNIMFGKSTLDDLKALDNKALLEIFEGVPQFQLKRSDIASDFVDLLTDKTGALASKNEARRALSENSISVNKQKVTVDFSLGQNDLLNDKYVLLQRGKRNYFLIEII